MELIPYVEETVVLNLGTIIVALLTPTAIVREARKWRLMAVGVSVFALTLNLFLLRHDLAGGLLRDAFALVFVTAGSPILLAAVSRNIAIKSDIIWERTAAAWFCTVILTAAGPFILLVVHCTSGDCL